jgi:hypothetical protein
MSYIKTGDIENKISPQSLNNWDREKSGEFWSIERDWWRFFVRIFGKAVQRRGVHVNTLKIGSRDGVFCIEGI